MTSACEPTRPPEAGTGAGGGRQCGPLQHPCPAATAAAAAVLGVTGAQMNVEARLSVADSPTHWTRGGAGVHGQVLHQRFGVAERLPADGTAVNGPGRR